MQKILKFGFSGGITYGINMGLTYMLIHLLFLSEKKAYFIALLCITLINFLFALKYIFKKNYTNSILQKYLFFLGLFGTLNYFLVFFIKNYFSFLDLFSSIFIITTLIFFLKYFMYDKIVFK